MRFAYSRRTFLTSVLLVTLIRLTSDKPLHVHLHGYDIESDVAPNLVTSLRFTATATGRFPIEIHSSEPRKRRPLAYLEVRPR